MLIILYNCRSDWMPADYLPAEILKDMCMHACMHASKQEDQLSRSRQPDLANRQSSNLEIPKVRQVDAIVLRPVHLY
jgi:hypothetical protein